MTLESKARKQRPGTNREPVPTTQEMLSCRRRHAQTKDASKAES